MNPLSPKGQFHGVKQLQRQFHSNLLVPGFCIIAGSKSNVNLLKIITCHLLLAFFPAKKIVTWDGSISSFSFLGSVCNS